MVNSFNSKVLCALSLLLFSNLTVSAQTPTPTPTEREIQLENENRELTLVKDNLTLKNDIRKAAISPSATPLEGKNRAFQC